MNGERVHAALELIRKRFIHHPVTIEPALSFESLRYDIHPEVGLPAWPMPGMTFVPVGFIYYVEAFGGESLGQLLRDEIAGRHGVRLAGAMHGGQCPNTGMSTVAKCANALVKS